MVHSPQTLQARNASPRNQEWVRALYRFTRNPSAIFGLVIVSLMILCAIFAPFIAMHSPIVGDLRMYVTPPSSAHFFGTDDIGRDVFSRTVYGAQISLTIALAAQASSLTIGLVIGLFTGYYGGILDTIVMRIVDMVMSFPLLIIAIALIGVLGASDTNIIITLALVSWPNIARLTRSQVLSLKEHEFITAARNLGASDLAIMFRHILPNLLTPLIVLVTLGIGGVILSEAALSFLGLGSGSQHHPSWGKMLTESRAFMRSAWWMPFFPGLAIFITVLGFNLLGDGLRDVLDVRSGD